MGGEGFARWAAGTNKNNRQLLRGDGNATYKNFDKSYITDYIISRKPRVFKEATPEYMAELHRKLQYRRKREIRRKIKAAIISVSIVGLLGFLLFFY
ncbi:hypothetical protein [Reichenbachiella ulvae]|uniref:Uncharacterized protein n=1 Tax=Reichenbachiella ulvae TaxID=2980104 RepID=A0ABT3CZI2_9BACT|nr:hypothetical protein [Reichenbachiella ulvae]MCV9389110.1 hypothetical protein [Reichenbachiella ulvae]